MRSVWKQLSATAVIAIASVLGTAAYYENNYEVIKVGENAKQNIYGETVTYSSEDLGATKAILESYNEIKNNYVFGVDKETLVDGAIKGMAESTGDIHTTYVPASKEEEKASTRLDNNYYGIGVQVTLQNGEVIVNSVFSDSPAKKEGIKAGDVILKAGKVEYKDQTLSEFVNHIKGEEGTKVKLKIKRGENISEVTVERKKIKQETVHAEMKENNIAYIDVDGFYSETDSEFKKAVKEMENKKFEKLVIDLRDNSGGYLDGARNMASLFLDSKKVVMSYETKDGTEKMYATGKKDADYPIEILVNEGTASSAEIFTLALRENLDNVTVIGTETYGKGVVQQVETVSTGGELKVTVAKWLSPKNNWLEEGKKGIKPDKVVENSKLFGIIGLTMEKDIEAYDEGDKSDLIPYFESFLNEQGYKIKNVDDKYEQETTQAVKQFQKDNGLEVDGKITEKVLEKMNEKLVEMNNETNNDLQLNEALK